MIAARLKTLERRLVMGGSCGLPNCPPVVLQYDRSAQPARQGQEPPAMVCWRCGRPAAVHTLAYATDFYSRMKDAEATP